MISNDAGSWSDRVRKSRRFSRLRVGREPWRGSLPGGRMNASYVGTSVLAAIAFDEQDPGELLLFTLDDRQCAVATALGYVTPEGLYSP